MAYTCLTTAEEFTFFSRIQELGVFTVYIQYRREGTIQNTQRTGQCGAPTSHRPHHIIYEPTRCDRATPSDEASGERYQNSVSPHVFILKISRRKSPRMNTVYMDERRQKMLFSASQNNSKIDKTLLHYRVLLYISEECHLQPS